MNNPVTYACAEAIVKIQIDNQPVNALSQAVRQGLLDCIRRFSEDDEAQIAIIVGRGRLFIGGADISEFGNPPAQPILTDVIRQIELCEKPVIAAIHGQALGGGLEVGLGAHYRLVHQHAKLGLPEVKLGLLPGAGGTQRLPRLVGVDTALQMITSGQAVTADSALNAGLADRIAINEDTYPEAIALARDILANRFTDTRSVDAQAWSTPDSKVRRTCDLPVIGLDKNALLAWSNKLEKSARGEVAPATAMESVVSSMHLGFDAGLQRERQLFRELLQTPQSAGLIHAFFSERKVLKLPEIEGVNPQQIEHIGVVGGGTMGAGIATSAALGGLQVTLVERDVQSADRARDTIASYLKASVKRGKIDNNTLSTILSERLLTVTDYQALSSADLIIEAVFESMDVKCSVFAELDAVAKPDAILATNTSYLDINAIASSISRPQSVIGLHFFSPAHIMKLLEVVVAEQTPTHLTATAFALAKKLGKTAVRAGVCDGFIGNRILSCYRTAADHMVLDGASPYQIDKALTDFGFAMGPYAVSDLAGLDIGFATRKRKAPDAHPRDRYPAWADELYQLGRLGQKTGRGYYLYQEGSRVGVPDPELEAIIDKVRQDNKESTRAFTDNEIVRRYMAAMVNEACHVLEEGIALRPLDIDIVFLYGYGFPRWRGGPMHWADQIGPESILADIESYALIDSHFWTPAPLLKTLVEKGHNFDSLNNSLNNRKN